VAETTIYICSDSTLTYGPYGGREKVVKPALPVCIVADSDEAERIITLVGRKAYHPGSDPDFKQALGKRTMKPGYGPETRYHYSLPNFVRNDPATLTPVRETLEAVRDAMRSDEPVAPIFEKAARDGR
jgi:hypothetical protein